MEGPLSSEGLPDRLAIARLEERRQAVSTAEIAPEAEEIAGGTMAFAGPGSWANQAAGLGLVGPVTDADLDRLVAFYVARGHEPRIEVASVADPSLHTGLAARGFVLVDWEHVLVRVLGPDDDLAWTAERLPADLALEVVDPTDDAAVRTWAELSMSGFHDDDRPASEDVIALSESAARHPRTTAFLARVRGVPAGAAGIEVHQGAAALFATSVLPAFRRRGLQLALLARRLEHARATGATLACIHSKPGAATERNAMRTGFFLGYAKAVLVKRGPGLLASP